MNLKPYMTVAAALVIALTANAHHSSSTYNLESQVTIEGTVTRVQWVNPHVFIYIDEITDGGQSRSWAVEGVNPASLRKIGWSRDTLELGDVIRVIGNPSKNMSSPGIYPNEIYHSNTKLFDEQEFFAGIFTVEEADTGTDSLAGVWRSTLNPAVILPRELEADFQPGIGLHDITAAGLEALGQFDELTMNPALNCQEITAPLIMHFGDNKEIILGEDEIRIVSEYDGGVRTIHMGVSSHDGATPTNQGHSIGSWEGNTLVVDTTHFADNNFGNGFGLPSSAQKHLQERITLSADGRSLNYQFTLTDPVYLAAPMTLESQLMYQPDASVIVDACDLESARRFTLN